MKEFLVILVGPHGIEKMSVVSENKIKANNKARKILDIERKEDYIISEIKEIEQV